jgi:hypothetical protein
MEARILRAAFVAAMLLVSLGAKYRSPNYVVETADPELARQFAEAAEGYRKTLALSWLGTELPNWNQPCPIKVKVGQNLGAGGATTFTFDNGQVFGWHMEIQGSRERVLDSVLPHEITHMIYASHFRRPLPRWADEGGATSVEHISERNKQRASLDQYLRTGRGIAFNKMFAMTEYPADILPLYAQGYSTAEFLIQSGGRRKYIAFLEDGLKANDWAGSLQKNYNLQNIGELQKTWLAWVKQGSPLKSQPAAPAPAAVSPEMIAAAGQPPRPAVDLASHTQDKAASAANVSAVADSNLLPVKPLVSISDHSATSSTAAKSIAMVPYTPGSTIAVSKLSIPSTGWRASYSLPLAATSATSVASEPYHTQVGRPQQLDAPPQTTMWR